MNTTGIQSPEQQIPKTVTAGQMLMREREKPTLNSAIKNILDELIERRGLDFHGYRNDMIERRVRKRVHAAGCSGFEDYYRYLKQHPQEISSLLDVLTINVSRFFRDSLTFAYLSRHIIPALINRKQQAGDLSVRVWSAGCAGGEEAYSMAIILKEALKKKDGRFDVKIFGTDVDRQILQKARSGIYTAEDIRNVQFKHLGDYFIQQGASYQVSADIKHLVEFYPYDLLDLKTRHPTQSVFGSFDLVLCRNVLIYYQPEYQARILKKLHDALVPSGHLILGEVESPDRFNPGDYAQLTKDVAVYQRIH